VTITKRGLADEVKDEFSTFWQGGAYRAALDGRRALHAQWDAAVRRFERRGGRGAADEGGGEVR
jgi:hypothetical protein